jgi:hypothetical protein
MLSSFDSYHSDCGSSSSVQSNQKEPISDRHTVKKSRVESDAVDITVADGKVAPVPLPAAHEVPVLAPASLNSLNSGTPEEQSVVDQLMANLDDPTSDLRNTSVLIKSNISSKKAESLIRRENLAFKLFCDVESKQLFAYELNGNDQHETGSSMITGQMYNYTLTAGVANWVVTSHGLHQFGLQRINPDLCLRLRNPNPTFLNVLVYRLTVQVGFTESVGSLHGHAVNFFAPNSAVQVYVLMKIYSRRANQTRAMVAVVYYWNQAHPVSFLSCGDAPLHPSFLQFYTAQYPSVALPVIQQNGVPPTPANGNQFVLIIPGNVIDLNMKPVLPPLQLTLDDLCARILAFP